MLVAANLTKNEAIAKLNEYLKQFMKSTPNATLGVLALGWASRSLQPAEMETALGNLKTRFPGNNFLTEMEKAGKQQQQSEQTTGESWVGKTVPELVMPDPMGKIFQSVHFAGNMLIDFLGELVWSMPDGKPECG